MDQLLFNNKSFHTPFVSHNQSSIYSHAITVPEYSLNTATYNNIICPTIRCMFLNVLNDTSKMFLLFHKYSANVYHL